MRENESLPDIEKLDQQEFNLDTEEQERLYAEREQAVEKVSGHLFAAKKKYSPSDGNKLCLFEVEPSVLQVLYRLFSVSDC